MSRDREDGFTLIEVLIALVILIVGLSSFYQAFGTGLKASDAADRDRETINYVDNLFNELGRSRPVREGVQEGSFPNGEHWHLKMERMQEVRERGSTSVRSYVVSLDLSPFSVFGAASRYKTIVLGSP